MDILRSPDDGLDWLPPRVVAGNGDPHFFSMDGVSFTFNGFGEYDAIRTEHVIVQLRLGPFEGLPRATVIDAVAIKPKEERHSAIGIYRRGAPFQGPSGMLWMDIFVGEERLEIDEREIYVVSDSVRVVVKDGSVSVIVNGVLSVNVGYEEGLLSFVAEFKQTLFGQTLPALLGSFNGDPTDEFRARNGVILPLNSPEHELHFRFGETWRTTAADSGFLYTPDKDYNTYNNLSFVPEYLSDLNQADSNINLAEVCGESRECIFDALITGDVNVARSTVQLVAAVQRLTPTKQPNRSPRFLSPIEKRVFVSGSLEIEVIVSDSDGDRITSLTVLEQPQCCNTYSLDLESQLNVSNVSAVFRCEPNFDNSEEVTWMTLAATDSRGGIAQIRLALLDSIVPSDPVNCNAVSTSSSPITSSRMLQTPAPNISSRNNTPACSLEQSAECHFMASCEMSDSAAGQIVCSCPQGYCGDGSFSGSGCERASLCRPDILVCSDGSLVERDRCGGCAFRQCPDTATCRPGFVFGRPQFEGIVANSANGCCEADISTWEGVSAILTTAAGRKRIRTGGLGRWLNEQFLVWLCDSNHRCAADRDPFCFVYDEHNMSFIPWARSSELRQLPPVLGAGQSSTSSASP